MTNIEEALKHKLLSHEVIAEMVGGRIFAGDMPEGSKYPQICLWCLQDLPIMSMGGPSSSAQPIYRVDCYTQRYGDTKRLRRAILDCLLGFTGPIEMPDGDIVMVSGITFVDGAAIAFKADSVIHGWELALEINYREELNG